MFSIRVAVVLVALALPASAHAATHAPDPVRALANATWRSPCGGAWKLVETDAKPNPYLSGAWVGFSNRATCTSFVRHAFVAGDAETRCTVILHEVGHLAGREHSTNPRSIMFPSFERVDPRCARLVRKVRRAQAARKRAEHRAHAARRHGR